jgi:hypothetical protein
LTKVEDADDWEPDPDWERTHAKFIETFKDFVVTLRRKALRLPRPEQRARLVDDAWADLAARFRKGGDVPYDLAARIRRTLIAETHFGREVFRPACKDLRR